MGSAASRRAELFALAAVVAVGLVRLVLFLSASGDAQIALIPDDAFYYLVPARSFALTGHWTFDGVAPATGFHLLYGYLLAALFRSAPDISDGSLVALLGGASTTLLGVSAYLVSRAAVRDFGAGAALGVVLAFTAPIAQQQQTLFVECSLVIFFSSALLALLARAQDLSSISRRWLAAALVVGLFGNLARSDFGVLSASCAASLWLLQRRSEAAHRQAALATVATLGAAGGVAAVSLHTWLLSGSVVQSSARMKQHWGELLGYDIRGLLRYLVDWIAPRDASWLGARGGPLLLVVAGVGGAVTRLGSRVLRIDQWPLAVGCGVSVVAYVVLYGNASAGVPPWYLANVLAALAYLLGAITSFIPARAFVPALAVVAVCAALDTAASLRPTWPNQVAMKAAGEYLRSHPEIAPVGAWNAGMMSYLARRPVVNLDGLVNDEIYPYATTGRLLDYVCARELRFVLDFSDNVENPVLARRAGYADGRLRAALTEEMNFSNGDPSLQWAKTDLKLYRLDARACPAK
jgi:hypothetical protein